MDPSCNSVFSFQTVFSAAGCYNQDTYHVQDWRVLACRPTCGKSVNEYFDRHEAMDPFYTGKMPKWLSDDALAFDNKKYYVVQESDLHENDWLLVFMEMVFLQENPVRIAPLEINKVVVETKEDYMTEAREKLHAVNAIFYISYKCTGFPADHKPITWRSDFVGDHKAVIRKTMDGIPGHMSLEIAAKGFPADHKPITWSDFVGDYRAA
ncbi:hypothetical protein AXX17_AT5G63390 [Arabidopsis thaliana]|uniref:Uncharacterized protein n=2 Tax=Arabidopsis thaliana TaxID=3702 RepID=A0A178UPI2_ARATH|nr:hypothetical protein AXX17_AT5G63390 [Arabidopsis thaliana]